MRMVDRLRIRQVIALIVVLPMVIGFVAAGLLALNENRARDLAVQELADLEALVVVRDLESAFSAERAYYVGWLSFAASASADGEGMLLTPAMGEMARSTVSAMGDTALGAIDGAPLAPEQRQDVERVVTHWEAMRAAFEAGDQAAVLVESQRLDDAMVELQSITEVIIARQGAPWLAIDTQSRFSIALAEEMSFIALPLTSGRSTEADRQWAAVLADRTDTSYRAMIAAAGPSQRPALETIAESGNVVELRAQMQQTSPTISVAELVTLLVGVTDHSAVIADARFESADEIRLVAQEAATTATTRRNLALGFAVVVLLGPLILVVSVGGRLSRRLERLAAAARRVSAGEMDVRIDDVSGRDEVAEVSAAFTEVAETIARSHDQISALAEGRTDDPVLDDELPGIVGQTLRVALRRLGNATAELAHQANHDRLTGLLDRRGLQVSLDLDAPNGDGNARGMILVDLDDFKQINDVHGHTAGDAVLCAVANRLLSGTRGGDLTARLGGDEFVILTAAIDTCEATAERLATHIAEPIEWNGQQLSVTASIGWTSVGVDEDFEDVVHRADTAMYRAKSSGKNQAMSG